MTDFAAQTVDIESLCHATAEASPTPLAAVEWAADIVRYVNPAFCILAGKTREEMIGRVFAGVLAGGEECLSILDRVRRSRHTETCTAQNNRDGAGEHDRGQLYTAWPVLSADDRPLGILLRVSQTTPFHRDAVVAMNEALLLGSIRQHELTESAKKLNARLRAEMTVSKQAQEALIRSEKLASVGRMAAVIAHEINNPLEAVMNVLYLIKTSAGLPEPVRQYVDIAESELNRVSHITRQTLGFYRESSTPTTFHIAPLLDSTLDMLRSKIKSKRATIEKRCDERLQITTISGELRQVFSNLLLNCLDALDENGMVQLRASVSSHCRNEQRCIRVTVGDNGHGISADVLPRIFEPFFTTKGSVGNGLGLWVSTQLVAKHGGSIRVRSSKGGIWKGTVFTVILPVEPETSEIVS